MSISYPELPEWLFDIEEISAGVYKVTGMNSEGPSVEKTGIDPDVLLKECRQYAQKFNGGSEAKE